MAIPKRSASGKVLNGLRTMIATIMTARATYTLLFPAPGERPEKIAAGHYRDIPGDVALRMDQNPGLEKLYVIVSDHPLDLPKYFTHGQLRADADHRGSADSAERHSDSADDVLDRLNKDLSDWAADSQTEGPAAGAGADTSDKGIVVDTYTVGPRTKPFLGEITLRHYAD